MFVAVVFVSLDIVFRIAGHKVQHRCSVNLGMGNRKCVGEPGRNLANGKRVEKSKMDYGKWVGQRIEKELHDLVKCLALLILYCN